MKETIFVTITVLILLLAAACGRPRHQEPPPTEELSSVEEYALGEAYPAEELAEEPPEEPPQIIPIYIPAEIVMCDIRCFNPDGYVSTDYDSPIPLDLAAQFFAQMCALYVADNGYLWGRTLHTPFMFVYPATRHVVANQQDSIGILSKKAMYM